MTLSEREREEWILPKPETIVFVGTNQYRLSRLSRLTVDWKIPIETFDLLQDPPLPEETPLSPAAVAKQKCLEAESLILAKGGSSVGKLFVAVDALNGFVHDGVTHYKAKPVSWDEIQQNFALLTVAGGYGQVVLDVAHAVHWSGKNNASFVVDRIHTGAIPADVIALLHRQEGLTVYQLEIAKYSAIDPFKIAGGFVWPAMFLLGFIERIDSVSINNPVEFTRIKGELLRHAISFDDALLSAMIRFGPDRLSEERYTYF